MSRVAVVSAIYGGYDEVLDPPLQTVEADWFMYTDQPKDGPTIWKQQDWRGVVQRGRPEGRLAAKMVKCQALYWARDYGTVVWLDGAARLSRPDSLEWLLDESFNMPWTGFAHPARDCIYDEVGAASTQPKYGGQPLKAQVEHYRGMGHPPHWGLWETGVIVRRDKHGAGEVGEAWWDEVRTWSLQDQLSLPYVLRQCGVWPKPLPGNYWDHEMVHRTEHLVDA